MNARISATLGFAGLVVGLALGCKSDPTNDGVGTPSAVLFNLKSSTLSPGDSVSFTAQVVDSRVTPLVAPITFSTCDAAVATVVADPTYNPVPPTSARAIVHAVAAPATCIVGTSGSAKPDTLSVGVLPTSFPGSLSSATPKGGDTLTINGNADFQFAAASAGVTFGGAEPGVVASVSANALKVLVPFSDPGNLTIDGVSVTYVSGLVVSLPSATSVTQTGDLWAADASWQTAPDITGMLPASGAQSQMLIGTTGTGNAAVCPEAALGFGSSGPCMMFKFTLADTATYKFSTDWEGGATAPDIDIYACADSTVANFGAACFEDGGAGATGVKPQATVAHKYPAGTHWFVVEVFDNTTPTRNIYTTISRP